MLKELKEENYSIKFVKDNIVSEMQNRNPRKLAILIDESSSKDFFFIGSVHSLSSLLILVTSPFHENILELSFSLI